MLSASLPAWRGGHTPRLGQAASRRIELNALTSERLTDIGAGATFYSTLVEVAKKALSLPFARSSLRRCKLSAMNWWDVLIAAGIVAAFLIYRRAGLITVKDAQDHLKHGALVIDVRTAGEFVCRTSARRRQSAIERNRNQLEPPH